MGINLYARLYRSLFKNQNSETFGQISESIKFGGVKSLSFQAWVYQYTISLSSSRTNSSPNNFAITFDILHFDGQPILEILIG